MCVRELSKAFCNAWKSGIPCSSGTTTSPSNHPLLSPCADRFYNMHQLIGPVIAVTGEKLDFFAVYASEYPVAVELDFVGPLSRVIGGPSTSVASCGVSA